jgi:hypothetical protein
VGLLFGAPGTPHRAPAPGTLAPSHPRTPYWLWCAFVPSYSAAVALFFIAERYRLPLLVPLVVGAGGAIDYAWRLISARQFRALVAPVVVALIIGALANAPSAVSDGRWEEGLRSAQRLVQLGRFDEAEAWVAKLESNAPRPGMAHAGLGKQLMLIDQPRARPPHLQKAVNWIGAPRLKTGYAWADSPPKRAPRPPASRTFVKPWRSRRMMLELASSMDSTCWCSIASTMPRESWARLCVSTRRTPRRSRTWRMPRRNWAAFPRRARISPRH